MRLRDYGGLKFLQNVWTVWIGPEVGRSSVGHQYSYTSYTDLIYRTRFCYVRNVAKKEYKCINNLPGVRSPAVNLTVMKKMIVENWNRNVALLAALRNTGM